MASSVRSGQSMLMYRNLQPYLFAHASKTLERADMLMISIEVHSNTHAHTHSPMHLHTHTHTRTRTRTHTLTLTHICTQAI